MREATDRGERGLQLVRHVCQQIPRRAVAARDLRRHLVERACERSHLVAAADLDALVELTASHRLRRPRHRAQRVDDAGGEQDGKQNGQRAGAEPGEPEARQQLLPCLRDIAGGSDHRDNLLWLWGQARGDVDEPVVPRDLDLLREHRELHAAEASASLCRGDVQILVIQAVLVGIEPDGAVFGVDHEDALGVLARQCVTNRRAVVAIAVERECRVGGWLHVAADALFRCARLLVAQQQHCRGGGEEQCDQDDQRESGQETGAEATQHRRPVRACSRRPIPSRSSVAPPSACRAARPRGHRWCVRRRRSLRPRPLRAAAHGRARRSGGA